MKTSGMGKKHRIAHCVALAWAGCATLADSAQAAADEVQTVVVTAQSRRQSAQDVPIAMQVLTSKDIGNLGARDLSGLNGYLPGLEIDGSQATQPAVSIRGVKAGDWGIGTDAPVGIYMDGVYTGKTGGALMNFIDVARVEVLKGPQGTLFGRNSAAGAIAVVTNQPDEAADSLAHLKIGSFRRVDADAMINVPLSERSAMRLVVVRADSDGWVRNHATGQRSGGNHAWAARLALKHKIGAAALTLSWEHEQLNQAAWPAFGVVKDRAQPLAGFAGIYDAAYTRSFADPRRAPLENELQGHERRIFDGVTLQGELPVGALQLRSITAYRTYHSSNLTDNDGTARQDYLISTLNRQTSYNWQQELKLSGKNGKLDWIAGASLFDSRESQRSYAMVNTSSLDTLSLIQGGPASFAELFGAMGQAGVPGMHAAANFPWQEHNDNVLRTRSASLYGDVIWHLGPRTSATVGLRWSHDRKAMQWHVPPRVSSELDATLEGGAALTGVGAAALPANLIFPSAQLAATPVASARRWRNWSPRLVLDHKADQHTLLYASLSQGYQAGGYNIFTPPNPQAAGAAERDPTFAPEKMSNLEVGFKMTLPALRATLNASLFTYRFKNLQDVKLSGGGAVPTYNIVNSDQKASGIDIDGRIKLTSATTLFGGLELIDQKYTRYRTVDGSGALQLDLSGQTVGTPLLSAMAGVTQSWQAFDGQASATLQGSFHGKTRCNADTRALQCLRGPGFSTGGRVVKSDLRLGWDNRVRNYGIALIVNNLFDRRYVYNLDGQGKSSGVPYASVTPPRMVALELSGSL